ncbi:hypothetical protein EDB83DRAFT_2328581 [Lactarius deliciosus]|nr:hypothetical protein EDB83DRAFT_2328581 [Lactarius deliciosus]
MASTWRLSLIHTCWSSHVHRLELLYLFQHFLPHYYALRAHHLSASTLRHPRRLLLPSSRPKSRYSLHPSPSVGAPSYLDHLYPCFHHGP